ERREKPDSVSRDRQVAQRNPMPRSGNPRRRRSVVPATLPPNPGPESSMRAALLLTALIALPLAAQHPAGHDGLTPAEDSVVAVAKRLFDGMRAHDGALLGSVFAEGAMLTGVPR